jgi:hypothetical protein
LAFGLRGGLWRTGCRAATEPAFGPFGRLADCLALERLLVRAGFEGFTSSRPVIAIQILPIPRHCEAR